MNFLSFQTLLYKNSILLKIKVSYEIFKWRQKSCIWLYMGIFSCQNVFLKSNENQLTSADIWLEYVNLVEIKHMGHLFHLVLDPELEFEGKNKKFSKYCHLCQIFEIWWHFWSVVCFWKIVIFAFKFKLSAQNWVEIMSHMFDFHQIDKFESNVSWCQLIFVGFQKHILT